MRIILVVGLALTACSQATPPTSTEFDGNEAHAWAAWQMALGPRIPGSAAHSDAASGIVRGLEAVDWVVERQAFEYFGTGLENIVARRGGEGEPVVILGAHYDTRPAANMDALDPSMPVPGANDGASGVAVLLEMARVLAARAPGRTVWLVFFDGEDSGSIAGWDWVVGSREFVSRLTIRPEAVVIVDMVGDADLQLYWERNSDPAIEADIWQTAARLGHSAFIPEARHSLLDDHTPFLQAGIPAVDIIDFDYPYWHTTEDTLDKISAASLEQVGRTLVAWLSGPDS
jgi:Zn-dependent M28 family amino/carboxypeptidase